MINFLDMYESYANEVYRFSLWLAGDSSEAEDITSETLIRAWAHNSKIRTETISSQFQEIFIYNTRERKSARLFLRMSILILPRVRIN